MAILEVKIINHSNNSLPEYATIGSAGMDLRAYISEAITLLPQERTLVPTGLFLEIPEGYEAQIRPRSGLALKQGITCLNAPGTIDSDYRGEIKVILINFDAHAQTIQPGDRIAQMIFSKVEQANWIETKELIGTERGAGGFGHSGTK